MCLPHATTIRRSRLHLSPSQGVHFIQPDHLGSPRVVIDAARNLPVWTWELTGEAFGNTPPNADPDGDGQAFTLNMRFPGQRYDSATGLNYNYFRDYEAGTGRYVQSDPIGLEAGLSTFNYVDSMPLSFIDPYGLQSWSPDYWRGQYGQISSWTNCYGYARGLVDKNNPGDFALFPRPTCQNLIEGALKDGLIRPTGSDSCGGKCPSGYYEIQIFLDDTNILDRDYHVYRQDQDGLWSHKRGVGSYPERNDSNGVPLSCPLRQPRFYPPRDYKRYCGTMCKKSYGAGR